VGLKSRISVGDPAGAEASKVPMFCHTVREGGLIRAWALIGEGVCVCWYYKRRGSDKSMGSYKRGGLIREGCLIRPWVLMRPQRRESLIRPSPPEIL